MKADEKNDLDVILSVGYRVKSPQGVRFRRWANGILKAQLLRRVNDRRLLKVFSFRTAAKLANALKMDFFPELREREAGDAAGVNHRDSKSLICRDW